MTTITALNVRLGMDASLFTQGADLARSEVTKLTSMMRQSVPPAEKYKQELDLLNRAFSEAGKKSKEYANAVEFLKKKHEVATPAIQAATRATHESVSATNAAMSSIKRLAAAYLGVQTVAKSIKLATEVEDATVAFEVLTGSVNDGKVLFQQIRDFSEKSPITFSGAAQATRTMMSFGVAAQDVQKNLQMLSDVTGGNNERFKMLSLAFSQTSAAGRLMGQDLLQMINAGFNPLQQISKTTGESLVDLKKRMEDGGISAEEVRKAFEDATAEGGMFHGMTERLAETMGGKLNIALSQLEKALAAAGQAMAPLIIMMTDGFEKGQGVLNFMVKTIEKIADGLGYMLAVAKDVISSIQQFGTVRVETEKFLDMLAKRDRDRAEAAAGGAQIQFENEKKAVEAVAVIDHKAIAEAQKERLRMLKEWEREQKRAHAAAQRERLRAIEEAAKAERDARREFERELESARRDALRFFEDRANQTKKMREDVSRGPGAGMEIGSAESARFFADQVNRQIGASVVPDESIVLERDVAKKTAELLIAQRESNARQKELLGLAERQLAVMQENGFRRIR
jgi:tape measure domain-containing protein